jgi:quinol monooxygenase YgiN
MIENCTSMYRHVQQSSGPERRTVAAVIIVKGSVVVRPKDLDQAVEIALEHVRRSRAEPGCLLHSVHQDVENPDRLVFLEHWADRAALDAHFAVPASADFVRRISALATEPPSIEVHETVEPPPG